MIKESIEERIDHLERMVLLHSFIYYQLNNNLVSDTKYEEFCRELEKLIKEQPEIFKKSVYYKIFKTWNRCTGMDFKYPQEIQNVAFRLMDNKIIRKAMYEREQKKNNTLVKDQNKVSKPKTRK